MTRVTEPADGRVLAGKYQLLHRLGHGGMGSVWLASHKTLRSPVAIKLMDPAIAANPDALARFLREARAAATLRSPHVVQILDHGVDGDTPYIAMEVLEGESVADRLRRLGALPPAVTARILTHVARAMARAHEAGIVHRDLKPHNIFLVENDDEEMAKVLDFGIAKTTLDGLGPSVVAETRTGALMGTLHYMSPEQAEGVKSVDFRTDIWAMGVIAFECLLGRRPFEGETIGTLVLELCSRPLPIPSQFGPVPAGFDAWFARVCARDPAARFASARDAAADLRRVCQARALAPEEKEAPRLPAEGVRTKLVLPEGPRLNGKVLRLGIAAGVAVVGAILFAFGRSGGAPAAPAAVSAPVASPPAATAPPPKPTPAPAPVAAPAAAAPEAVAPPPAPVAVEPPPPAPAKPSPAAERPRRRAEKASPAKPAPRPAASADPKAPPAAPPAEKPKVNLGI